MSAVESFQRQIWYAPEVPDIPPAFRGLLINYAKIKPEDINKHLLTIVSFPPLSDKTLTK
jgi:hypothetical protein